MHASAGSTTLIAPAHLLLFFYDVFDELQALTALIRTIKDRDSTWSLLPALPPASCVTSLNRYVQCNCSA